MTQGIPLTLHATTDYGHRSLHSTYKSIQVHCPLPGCIAFLTLTESNNLPWHNNTYGFSCDGSGLPPKKAAAVEVDANGRLINLDEMKVVDL